MEWIHITDELLGALPDLTDQEQQGMYHQLTNFETPWGMADEIDATSFLLIAFNFKPVLDSDTFKESLKGLDWISINYIIKDLKSLFLIAPYAHKSLEKQLDKYPLPPDKNQMDRLKYERWEKLRAVDHVKDLIHQTINKIEGDGKNELRKEYILSNFNPLIKRSCLYNDERLLREFWGYFKNYKDEGTLREFWEYYKNPDELEEACIAIEKSKEDAKQKHLRVMQKVLRKLEKVHVSIRELKKNDEEVG
ncbi:hypothetical protein phytr_8640 [Candidatus Phycorickettsia trachydisci]|uniref:Uncharacterized protein n=1 Tax=Candidatus Phycorickettsia trachydisci TaxID=2115978 RepID=A0A2P1P955_9RICK|nr:hypothetical protein [Candidatus Phycorickettsia trachydisci]AVP87796.1 hypothetical protein phytr_8640 [Candidatus Phycorickettsia trachydisci]